MWTSVLGYVLPFRCVELYGVCECIVSIRVVWYHVNEIRDASYVIGSCYEIYSLELLDVT